MSNAPHILLAGNTDIGLQYVGYAKSKLIALKRLGLPYLSRTFVIDAVEIFIKITPQCDRVLITASYSPYISGFLDTFPILPTPKFDSWGDPIPLNPFQYTLQDTEEQRTLIVPPDTDPVPKMFGIRTITLPTILSLTQALPVEPGAPPLQTTIRFREVYENFLPSKFTGLMRQVMQVAHATFQWNKLTDVPLDYHFGNCFGVIKNPVNKAYYMVRIDQAAVWYIPATFKVSQTGVSPNVTDVIRLVSMKRANAVKIADLPADIGASWSDEIGWAFSYTSPEAAIVYESSQFVGNQLYITAELLTLNFSFDNQTGLPDSARLKRNGANIFWNHHITSGDIGWGLFNIPQFGLPYPEPVARLYGESVDFGVGVPVPYVRPMPYQHYQVIDMPVYVYYTKAGGPQICTYSWMSVDAQSFTQPYDPAQVISCTWNGTKAKSGYVQYGFSCNGSSKPQADGDNNSTITEYFNIGEGMTLQNNGGGSTDSPIIFATSPANPGHAYQISGPVLPNTTLERDRDAQTSSRTGGAVTVESSLTLSITDRECALICSSRTPLASTYTVSHLVGSCMLSSTNDLFLYAENGVSQPVVSGSSYPVASATGYLNNALPFGYPWTVSGVQDNYNWLTPVLSLTAFGPTMTSYIGCPNAGPYNTIGAQAGLYTATPASSPIIDLILYAGTDKIEMNSVIFNSNNLMFNVHPFPQIFDFKVSTAALNPHNMAYDNVPGAAVVQFDGMQYPVEHKLFGWIGQA